MTKRSWDPRKGRMTSRDRQGGVKCVSDTRHGRECGVEGRAAQCGLQGSAGQEKRPSSAGQQVPDSPCWPPPKRRTAANWVMPPGGKAEGQRTNKQLRKHTTKGPRWPGEESPTKQVGRGQGTRGRLGAGAGLTGSAQTCAGQKCAGPPGVRRVIGPGQMRGTTGNSQGRARGERSGPP